MPFWNPEGSQSLLGALAALLSCLSDRETGHRSLMASEACPAWSVGKAWSPAGYRSPEVPPGRSGSRGRPPGGRPRSGPGASRRAAVLLLGAFGAVRMVTGVVTLRAAVAVFTGAAGLRARTAEGENGHHQESKENFHLTSVFLLWKVLPLVRDDRYYLVIPLQTFSLLTERARGVEPLLPAWKAGA